MANPVREADILLTHTLGNEGCGVMGGGMVDPNGFDAVGIDREKATG